MSAAQIAGIMGVKQTPHLIPMSYSLPVESIDAFVNFYYKKDTTVFCNNKALFKIQQIFTENVEIFALTEDYRYVNQLNISNAINFLLKQFWYRFHVNVGDKYE